MTAYTNQSTTQATAITNDDKLDSSSLSINPFGLTQGRMEDRHCCHGQNVCTASATQGNKETSPADKTTEAAPAECQPLGTSHPPSARTTAVVAANTSSPVLKRRCIFGLAKIKASHYHVVAYPGDYTGSLAKVRRDLMLRAAIRQQPANMCHIMNAPNAHCSSNTKPIQSILRPSSYKHNRNRKNNHQGLVPEAPSTTETITTASDQDSNSSSNGTVTRGPSHCHTTESDQILMIPILCNAKNETNNNNYELLEERDDMLEFEEENGTASTCASSSFDNSSRCSTSTAKSSTTHCKVVRFDPRIIITEYQLPHNHDPHKYWYSASELISFRREICTLARDYYCKHHHHPQHNLATEAQNHPQRSTEPRALFAMPFMNANHGIAEASQNDQNGVVLDKEGHYPMKFWLWHS